MGTNSKERKENIVQEAHLSVYSPLKKTGLKVGLLAFHHIQIFDVFNFHDSSYIFWRNSSRIG